MVQFKTDSAFGDQPLVSGHFHVLVVNHQVRGVKDDPHPLADQPDGDRVAVRADRDLAVAVDPRGEQPPGLERLLWQRHQQWSFEREVLGDGPGPGADPSGIVLPVPLLDHLVQLGERGHLGNGDELVAPEVADLALDAALLVGAFDARTAVEALDCDLPWVQEI
ncbi:hypothetical protein ABT330_32325 [Streptomyces sp. NPDC000658]|uniref:hypothetical protein n=1 Tax=Streptomyces sp. NPDC000658 TaxID=3154266 RepID=UPI0033165828